MTVWLVTPAYRRYELTAICLEQHRRVAEALAPHGIGMRHVVIADDENLDIARSLGCDVVEQDNEWLGRRFNDGIEYAARNGASRIVPIGSDSWIDPAFFLPLPHRSKTRTSRRYCVVQSDRLAELVIDDEKGVGPHVYNRLDLRHRRFRPARDDIRRGVDASLRQGIRVRLTWQVHDLHPYQYVGFRSEPHLTPYATLVGKYPCVERRDPWAILAKHYPVDLVERARAVLS